LKREALLNQWSFSQFLEFKPLRTKANPLLKTF